MKNKLKVEKDLFNSEIFNLSFGNITEYDKNIEYFEINELLSNSEFDIVGIRINSRDTKAMYNFQKNGFYLVDCLVTYEYDVNKSKPLIEEFNVDFKDNLEEKEILSLANIASKVFEIDRFHSDPNLSKEDSDKYYYQWVINSFSGYSDGAIIPTIDGKAVGFTTYKIGEDISTMVLSAVDPDYMGRGIYYNMILKGTSKLIEYSPKVRVGTQVDNIPVQRTWQKLGYKLIDVNYVLHKKIMGNTNEF